MLSDLDLEVLRITKDLRKISPEEIKKFGYKEMTIQELYARVGIGNKAQFGRIVLEDPALNLTDEYKGTRMTNLINHPDKYKLTYDERQAIIRNLRQHYI